jgi:hypothetical protein
MCEKAVLGITRRNCDVRGSHNHPDNISEIRYKKIIEL